VSLRRYRLEVDWPTIEAAWSDEHAGPGRLGASIGEAFKPVKRPCRIVGVQFWKGLFGGAHHDPPNSNLPIDPQAGPELDDVLSHGQIQEVTLVPLFKRAGKDRASSFPFDHDLHQLYPSMSFDGTGPGELFPEYIANELALRDGDLVGFQWNCSQKDRGAHVVAKIWVVE
jgi:hypothetical protein